MDETTRLRYDTIHNKVVYVLRLYPPLVNLRNDDLIDKYRETFPGDDSASESITRAWRKLRSEGLFLPTSEESAKQREIKEKEFKEYYSPGS